MELTDPGAGRQLVQCVTWELLRFELTKRQRALVALVAECSLGWGRADLRVGSRADLAALLGLDRGNVSRTLDELAAMRILEVTEGTEGTDGLRLRILPDADHWQARAILPRARQRAILAGLRHDNGFAQVALFPPDPDLRAAVAEVSLTTAMERMAGGADSAAREADVGVAGGRGGIPALVAAMRAAVEGEGERTKGTEGTDGTDERVKTTRARGDGRAVSACQNNTGAGQKAADSGAERRGVSKQHAAAAGFPPQTPCTALKPIDQSFEAMGCTALEGESRGEGRGARDLIARVRRSVGEARWAEFGGAWVVMVQERPEIAELALEKLAREQRARGQVKNPSGVMWYAALDAGWIPRKERA